MVLTPRRKLALGTLGLAVAALVADRGFFQPASASAGNPAGEYAVDRTAASSPLPTGTAVDLSRSMAGRLQAVAEVLEVNPLGADMGTVARWRPVEAPVVEEIEPAPVEVQDTFASRYRLTGVMGTGGRGRIILDGNRRLALGDELDGYTLVEVAERSAVFRSGRREVVLEVVTPLLGAER